MTRNIVPERPSRLYKKVYALVLEANMRAIAAAKPGMTTGDLDAVARRFLKKNGFDKEFGHSLGHGVGVEIHEAPAAAKKQKTVLKPGMSVTIVLSSPINAFSMLDLPAFGLPTIAKRGRSSISSSPVSDLNREQISSSRSPLPKPFSALNMNGSPNPNL